jgi:hypothetical protein
MRHFLAARPVATCPRSMGEPAPDGWFGSAVRQHANCNGGPVAHNRRGNRFAHGRSSCRSAPGTDIRRTHKAGRTPCRLRRIGRHHVDERHYCLDTRASILAPHACPARCGRSAKRNRRAAKFRSASCLPLDQGKPLPALRSRAKRSWQPIASVALQQRIRPVSPGGDTLSALHVAGFERV